MPVQLTIFRLLPFAAVLFLAVPLCAVEPTLHDRIDEAVAAAHVGPFAAIANDYEFLRRVYLDLVGRTPTSTELREFANDSDEAKRNQVVGKLLSSDEFDQHFVRVLDVMLMERRSGKRVDQQAWLDFLSKAVEEKWTFDSIVQEIMIADGTGDQRGAAKWLLAREVEPNALTRDIGRLFFGRDLQCAQCHDHPNIVDYEQSEYYGIYAFVNRSYLFEDNADNKKAYVGEKAEGETEFQSVFLPDEDASQTIPTLLGGLALDIEPKISSTAYLVEPSKTAAGVPRFSRRTHLARLITHSQNEHFAKNSVNRFWAHMLGRGFVHPVDFHHADNPPSHPALLKLLADEFVAMDFDYRELLKQIALSDTYQRSIDFPPVLSSTSISEQRANLAQKLARWRRELEQLNEATNTDAVVFERQLERRRSALTKLDEQIKKTSDGRKANKDAKAKLTKTLVATKKQITTLQSQLKAVTAAATAAKKVSETLPKDVPVANARREFDKRVATVTKTVTAKKKAVEKHQAEINELTKQISEGEKEVAKLQGKRLGVADMVAEARGAVSVFRAQRRREAARRNELERRITSAEDMAGFLAAVESSKSSQQKVESLADRVRKAEHGLKMASEAVSQLQGKLAASHQTVETSRKELAALKLKLKQNQELLAGLDLVVANLKASEHLAGETDVALSVLEEKRTTQGDEISNLETAIATSEKKASQFASDLTKLRQNEADGVASLLRAKADLTKLQQQHKVAIEENRKVSAEQDAATNVIRDSWQRRNAVRNLTPLTPEQLAGATITGLGLDARYRNEATREWEKNQKAKADKAKASKNTAEKTNGKKDNSTKAAEIESLYNKRVDTVINTYVSMFAAPGGAPQDVFSATADQALFLSNDGRLQNWLSPAEGTLLKRLQSTTDASDLADELYLSILCRPATEQEQVEFEQYLEERTKDRNKALREVAWGLLSSLEFRFNH